MDSKEFQKEFNEKAGCALKTLKDGGKVQNFILCVVEFVLPIFVVLSLIGCVIVAIIAAFMAHGFFSAIAAFITTLIASVVAVCFTFYFIYAIKAIKDSVAGKSCCCDSEVKNSCCGSDDKCESKTTAKETKDAKDSSNIKPARKAPARAKKTTTKAKTE
jgi:energy-coupling factor transporter transmembrane protein EcfT